MKRTGAFDAIDCKIVPWQLTLTADETMALYATYSDITAREDREAVLKEVGRDMTTSVFVGRKLSFHPL